MSAQFEQPAIRKAANFPVQSEASADGQPAKQENACGKKWWWVAIAAALALLGRGGSSEQAEELEKPRREAAPAAAAEGASDAGAPAVALASAESSAVPVAAPAKDPAMSFNVDASGVPALTVTVGTEAEKRSLIDALSARLGVDKFHANITVDPDTKPAAWIARLAGLLPLMELPEAQVRIADDHVDLSGHAADPTLGMGKLKAVFGDSWTVTARGAAGAQAASDAATPACAPADMAKKLNLTAVNFGFASNALPRAALTTLAASAKSLKDCHARPASRSSCKSAASPTTPAMPR